MGADQFVFLDMQALEALLRDTVKPHLRDPKNKDFRILNLACGSCDEAGALVKFAQDQTSGAVSLTGADIRIREILQAREAHGHLPAEFLLQDATKISEHKELGGDFNMVMLRHQNFWNQQELWKKIFEQGLEKVGDDGLLVITSYFDKEHQMALEALGNLGAELIDTRVNAVSRQLITPGKSVDKHIAVLRRRK